MRQTLGETRSWISGSPRRCDGMKLIALGMLGMMILAPKAAIGSPIQARDLRQAPRIAMLGTARALATGNNSDRYLAQALRARQWNNVPGPNVVRLLSWGPGENGRLPDSPFIEYLRWRRGLNPARFDAFHPRLGRLLDQEMVVCPPPPPICPEPGQLTPPSPPIPPEPILPPEPPPIVSPEPPSPQNPEIPEPSSVVVALTLLAAGTWVRRRSRMRKAGDVPNSTG